MQLEHQCQLIKLTYAKTVLPEQQAISLKIHIEHIEWSTSVWTMDGSKEISIINAFIISETWDLLQIIL